MKNPVDDPRMKTSPTLSCDPDYIRRRAYEMYELRGKLDGFDVYDWLIAEAESRESRQMPKAA
jgi:hypothetical protein